MLAKEVMTKEVFCVAPETTVSDIAKLLLARKISAVPVLDTDEQVIGIVSEGDLMRRTESGTDGRHRTWWSYISSDPEQQADMFVKIHGLHASEVMTNNVVAVDEDTDLSVVAQTMEDNHINRVLVMSDGNLVGIVSRSNLLGGLAARSAPPVNRDDRDIQDELMALLRKEQWAGLSEINVTVSDGVVHLSGMINSHNQARALHVAAECIAGVRAVDMHLQRMQPAFWI